MTLSTDLCRTIQTALAAGRPRPTRTPGPAAPSETDWNAPRRDPDWALREIVDDMLFETIR